MQRRVCAPEPVSILGLNLGFVLVFPVSLVAFQPVHTVAWLWFLSIKCDDKRTYLRGLT